MFPSSLVVVVAGLLLVAIALGAYVWAWRRGQFSSLDAQSRVILDERDVRLSRPWETPDQRADRVAAFGRPVAPTPSEWGGA